MEVFSPPEMATELKEMAGELLIQYNGIPYPSYVKRRLTGVADFTVSHIGKFAFANCENLQAVDFPNCLTVEECAFSGCTDLQYAYLPICKSIDRTAFIDCSNLTLEAPRLSEIPDGYYLYSKSYIFTSLGFNKDTFPLCTGKSLIFDNVSRIGSGAFGRNKVLERICCSRCKDVGKGAFMECFNLKTAVFPVCSVIQGEAFIYCHKLTNLYMPKCREIWTRALQGCRMLQSISLPECEYLGDGAFYDCASLKAIYLLWPYVCSISAYSTFINTPIASFANGESSEPAHIYVPASLYSAYISAYSKDIRSNFFMSAFEPYYEGDEEDE